MVYRVVFIKLFMFMLNNQTTVVQDCHFTAILQTILVFKNLLLPEILILIRIEARIFDGTIESFSPIIKILIIDCWQKN
jgi:hypothetical protein